MKLTKETLKRIIKEELKSVLEEKLDIQADPHFSENDFGTSKMSFPTLLWNECIRWSSGQSNYRNLNAIAYDVAAFLKNHEDDHPAVSLERLESDLEALSVELSNIKRDPNYFYADQAEKHLKNQAEQNAAVAEVFEEIKTLLPRYFEGFRYKPYYMQFRNK
jgi:hypothetical protein